MNEIWKSIPGYEDAFEVSNLGNFRSKDRFVECRWGGLRKYPGKTLKVEIMQDGYCRIVLMQHGKKKRYMCHRLVAEVFIDNPQNKPFINHIDGNKSNNCVSNLEWCTQSENEQHSINVLGKTMKNKTYPKKVRCVETNIEFSSMKKAVEAIGNRACIEGLKKAILAQRKYHGLTYEFIK